MINNLILETRKYISSAEYSTIIHSVIHFYDMTEDQGGILIGRTNALLLGTIKEENFIGELISNLEIPAEKARSIAERVKKEVVQPFKQTLIAMLANTPNVDTSVIPKKLDGFSVSNDTLRQAPQSLPSAFPTQKDPPAPRPVEPMTKEHILAQIENPPRTVIKKYIIEHEPIKDPEHLIQDHYTD